ncbi:hypothetical protein TELCIR_12335 [Teladorsagia circumcincta]|uniref:Uncharacterized protein n=1 Tax=Teladorsagia circumcincta TaxID=45464 RepID=A0A2G9U716_TELCI|nr:hypothetical protein TELCIR_12335 [Teladorsagia circumcincta]
MEFGVDYIIYIGRALFSDSPLPSSATVTPSFPYFAILLCVGENTSEEELCWGVDSTVRVPPSSETVAELVILEEQCSRDFRIENRMSGKILVTVTNLKLNNSLVTVIEGNIADIIRGMANYAAKGFTIDGNGNQDLDEIVKYETKGTCVFRYGVEQKVKINETALRSYYK